MKIISLSNGEQNAGIYPHSSTHHSGGTDEISAEAIGARPAGINIDWGELDLIPESATRWPGWSEVAGKPFSAAVTYGAISVAGTTGAYSGIQFSGCAEPQTTFMVRASDGLSGLWTPTGWKWYFNGSGVLAGGTVPWGRLSGIPETFPPSAHSHSRSAAINIPILGNNSFVEISGLTIGMIFIYGRHSNYQEYNCFVVYRVDWGSCFVRIILKDATNIQAVLGVVPNGTTGNSGNLTIFAGTDGKIFLENRTGQTLSLGYHLMNT